MAAMRDPIYGGGASAALRVGAHEALKRHQAEGTLPTSLRHIFYEALMAEIIPKTPTGARRADQGTTDAITDLPGAGLRPGSGSRTAPDT